MASHGPAHDAGPDPADPGRGRGYVTVGRGSGSHGEEAEAADEASETETTEERREGHGG